MVGHICSDGGMLFNDFRHTRTSCLRGVPSFYLEAKLVTTGTSNLFSMHKLHMISMFLCLRNRILGIIPKQLSNCKLNQENESSRADSNADESEGRDGVLHSHRLELGHSPTVH